MSTDQRYMSDCPKCGAKRLYERACPQCGFPPHYPMHHTQVLSDEEPLELEASRKPRKNPSDE